MIDWSQFLPDLIATFIGFLLALSGERMYDKYKDWRESKEIAKLFIAELENMSTIVVRTANTSDKSWINPIKTPTWDSAVSSKSIALLARFSWYNKLFELYDAIKDYNSWHNLRTNLFFEGKQYDQISQSLLEASNGIITQIDDLLLAMGNCLTKAGTTSK